MTDLITRIVLAQSGPKPLDPDLFRVLDDAKKEIKRLRFCLTDICHMEDARMPGNVETSTAMAAIAKQALKGVQR